MCVAGAIEIYATDIEYLTSFAHIRSNKDISQLTLKVMRIIVIGGVAAGASAAAKARRESESAEIIMFEKGPYISFANCGLPYYLSGEIEKREDLMVWEARAFEKRYNVRVYTEHEAKGIDAQNKTVEVEDLKSGERKKWDYNKLIYAPGARPILLPFFRGKNLFTLRDIPDADAIKNYIEHKKPERALMIGAGFIGLEVAEAFVKLGLKVTVVELMPQVLPNMDADIASYVEKELRDMGVNVVLNRGVKDFVLEDEEISEALLDNGEKIPCDLVFASIGVRPDIELAKSAGIETGSKGIIVNDRMETSIKDIFAAGDAVESLNIVAGKPSWVALAGPANQQGRVAGANAAGGDIRYKGTLGTFIIRVGSMIAAKTGLSEREAEKEGYDFFPVYAHPPSHADYYPGAETLHMKLVVERKGRILGAQITGKAGVDKRIDVIATAIYFGADIRDLEHLNLAYAPPFGSARDPVNIAGMVGSHILDGSVEPCYTRGDEVFLDVRTEREYRRGHVDGAIHVPVDDLRERINGLNKDNTYAVYCREGYRSYLAYRILKQRGFRVKNYAGGYLTYLTKRS